MEKFIKKFNETGINDVAEVGGKNASLGEMYTHLTVKGLLIPDGFAITASAYRYFIAQNNLAERLQELMANLDRKGYTNLADTGASARKLIMNGHMPPDLQMAIIDAYDYLFDFEEHPVAVRS